MSVRVGFRAIGLVLVAYSVLMTSSWAACSNPTRDEGTMVYNGDHKVMQYCDGTIWRQIGKKPAILVSSTIALDDTTDWAMGDTGIHQRTQMALGVWFNGDFAGGQFPIASDIPQSTTVESAMLEIQADYKGGSFSNMVVRPYIQQNSNPSVIVDLADKNAATWVAASNTVTMGSNLSTVYTVDVTDAVNTALENTDFSENISFYLEWISQGGSGGLSYNDTSKVKLILEYYAD